MPLNPEQIKAIGARAAGAVLENRAPEEVTPEAEPKHEERPCPNLQPMAEWIKGETPGTCRPCILAPVVQWYYQELKEQGDEETAAQLEAEVNVLEEDNVEQVMALCKDLDQIKAAAPEELRKRFEEFDCAIQSFDPDEISEPSEEAQTADSPSSSQPPLHNSDSESISP